MRKIALALAVCLLPLLGVATSGPASAAAAGNMTLLDRLGTVEPGVEQVTHRCYRRSRRVCSKSILGKCLQYRTQYYNYCPRHRRRY